MRMRQYLTLLSFGLVLIVATGVAQEHRRVITARSTVLSVSKTNDAVVFSSPKSKATHWYALGGFSVQSQTNSSPQSFIIAGRVIDRNAGAAGEQIPVFWGAPLIPPRLAAITDANGQFSFRVHLKEDHRDALFQTRSITNADIYVGEASIYVSDSFDARRELSGGLVRKYTFTELLIPSGKSKEAGESR